MRKILIGIVVVGALLILSNMVLNRGSEAPPVPGQPTSSQTIKQKEKNTPAPVATKITRNPVGALRSSTDFSS
ncbi:MAG: hypothetical protein M1358_06070 [Chloroflexi bacterium]|nr:hypothetical protein [Chloroflexota bacterium]